MKENVVRVLARERKLRKKKFITDVLFRLIIQIILRLRSLILIPLIAKTMGSLQYGAWAQITVTLSLLVPVMMLRLETASVRYLSSKRGKAVGKEFFPILFLIWLLLIMASGFGLFFREQIAYFLFKDRAQILYVELFLLFLIVRTTFTFLCNYYRTFNQIKKYSAIELITTFASIGIAIFFILSGRGLVGVLLSFILVEASACILVLIDITRQIGLPHNIKMVTIGFYLHYSLPLIPNVFLFWVINSSDRYLITHILDLKQVGIYSVSYLLGHLAIFFLTPITFVLFPTISKLWEEKNRSECKRYIQNSIKYYILISLPSIFGIYYLAPALLRGLATQEFITDRFLVLLIILGFFCVGLYQIYLYIIHLREQTKYLPLVFFTAASLNLGLNLFLIPKIGIIGAAFSTFLAYLVLTITVIAISARLFWVGFDIRFFGKTVIASVGMFLILRLFKLHNIGTIFMVTLVGAASYFILMVLMRGVGRKEWKLLKTLTTTQKYIS